MTLFWCIVGYALVGVLVASIAIGIDEDAYSLLGVLICAWPIAISVFAIYFVTIPIYEIGKFLGQKLRGLIDKFLEVIE